MIETPQAGKARLDASVLASLLIGASNVIDLMVRALSLRQINRSLYFSQDANDLKMAQDDIQGRAIKLA